MTSDQLLTDARMGDRRSLAQAISRIEASPDDFEMEPNPGVPVIGVTGPPGVGKSTLVNALVTELRRNGRQIGVVAVDPSSPLTGGALLGDRIRMQDHIEDKGVFIRSMAARGHLGGLAVATRQTVSLLTQSGFDTVIVETVGVGQSEVEVMDLADPVVLVVSPEWGDQIQADKAGIVEVADIFVINKADRPGVDKVHRVLTEIAENGGRSRPVVRTEALSGDGIPELLDYLF